jgi:uncharacterized membrane protein
MLNKKIFLIFFFAFIIRLIALNQSLWMDEAVTSKVAMTYDFSDIVSKFSPTDFHPPLYYLFMKSWTNVFGYSEVALRFPSIMFSLLTGYFIYKIASLFHGSIVKEWPVIFFLFNPLIVYYSQEARMYMMAVFLLTGGLYYFLKYQKKSSNIKDIFMMNLFFALAFFSFYGSAFFIATIFLYFLYKKNYKIFILNTLYFILVFLVISPLLYQQLLNSKIALASVTNWSLVLGKANIKNLLLIPIKFSIGRISFYPKLFYWVVSGIWTIIIFWKIFLSGFKNKFLLFLFIFPLTLGFIVSFFTPMLQYFRFIYLIPLLAILLSRKNVTVYCYGVTFGFVAFSLIYLFFPQFHREDWKSLVQSLPKDKPVYMIPSSSDPVKYYSNNLKINDLSLLNNSDNEIIVIPYTADIHGLDYKSNLRKSGYVLKNEVSYRELTYERWIK